MKTKFLDVFLAAGLLVVVVSGFSYTWTPMSPVSLSGVISVSADGRIVCACPSTVGQLRVSRDWGQTWFHATNAPPNGSLALEPVALSASGSQIVACLSSNSMYPQWLFLSTDFGTNWTKLSLPGLSGSSYCVACSAAGSNLVAAAMGGSIYFSTNTGANWLTSSAPTTNWWSLASSADARRMAAAVNGGRIYLSTDFGNTWTNSSLLAQPWKSVCVSADGLSLGATGTNSYISRNAGASWMTNTISGDSIACSADGSKWMIAGVQIYTSSDGGVTWFTNFSSAGWGGAMSADGCEIVLDQTLGFGGVTNWVGHITPSPQLNIQSSDNNFVISWLLPSTNFAVQQTADLGSVNWVSVTNNPALNFKNLQQEVSVPATASNAFFRLIAQ